MLYWQVWHIRKSTNGVEKWSIRRVWHIRLMYGVLYRVCHITTLCDTLDWSRSSRYHTADVTTWLERDSPHSLLWCWWYNCRCSAHCEQIPKNIKCQKKLSNFSFPQFFFASGRIKSWSLKTRHYRPSLLTGFRLTYPFLLSIICNALQFLTSLHMIDCKFNADP